MAMSVSALVQYTGAPQLPYLVYGKVSWNDQLLAGARLEITNQGTGYSKQITTDSNGYWQEEAGNWLTNAGPRPPIQYGDIIKVKVLDGCGVGDTCEKSFTAKSEGYDDWAEINFDINGELSCPPISCPSCSGGGGSCYYSETKCRDKYPCSDIEDTECPTTSYPTCEDTTCPEVTEPTCEEPVCPPISSGTTPGEYIILIIGLALAGTAGAYWTRNKALSKGVGIKTYLKRDGTTAVLHKHPGTTGYHDPNRSHTPEKEKHEKGQLFPKYQKDASGEWMYVE